MLKENKRNLYIVIVLAFTAVVLAAVYFTFIHLPKCENFGCFQKNMVDCSKSTYINEEPEASWKYEIAGKSNGMCMIKVTMLNAKKGELGVNRLVGEQMDCLYPMGMFAYPEKDLTKCHGLLKEDLQTIVINKLHAYILENLGKFEEGLEEAI